MSFTAAQVMARASTILQDDQAVRWTATELRDHLNDGLREIVTMKPNAKTITTTINLVAGTRQTLAATHTILVRVVRNDVATNKRAVRPLARRELLDSQIPGWQDTTVLPFSEGVTHVIHELTDPRSYYVVPGNTGTGKLEVVVGTYPAAVPLPVAPLSALEIADYTTAVDISDVYQNALVDYVLYRAFSKDAGMPGAAQRATAHYELFKGAIGTFAAAEGAMAAGAVAARANQA